MPTIVKFYMQPGCEDLQPRKAHADDAAYDLRSREEATLDPRTAAMVPTGLFLELPAGFEAQVRPRSGLAAKSAITVLNSPGTIDAGYRGEVKVILFNAGTQPFQIERGDRIAQMVIQNLPEIELEIEENLAVSTRGAGGFGSTGKN